nr:hypothetical protein [Sphingomonas sp. H160509]
MGDEYDSADQSAERNLKNRDGARDAGTDEAENGRDTRPKLAGKLTSITKPVKSTAAD